MDEPIFRAGTDRDADRERGRVGKGGGGRGSGRLALTHAPDSG